VVQQLLVFWEEKEEQSLQIQPETQVEAENQEGRHLARELPQYAKIGVLEL